MSYAKSNRYSLEIAVARSLTSGLMSSAVMSQGMGPNPTEKKKMKTERLTRGRNSSFLAVAGSVCCR